MWDRIDLQAALIRGRYMAAAARIEWNGIPIDTAMLNRLRDRWDGECCPAGSLRELSMGMTADYEVAVEEPARTDICHSSSKHATCVPHENKRPGG